MVTVLRGKDCCKFKKKLYAQLCGKISAINKNHGDSKNVYSFNTFFNAFCMKARLSQDLFSDMELLKEMFLIILGMKNAK